MIRVLRYGALKPPVGFELMLEQIQLAHRYQNKLLEIERWYRAALWFEQQNGVAHDVRSMRNAEIRAARKASGLGYGTYQLAERAAQQSCKRWQDPWFSEKLDPRKSLGRMRPRFQRFTGEGSVAACLQRSGCKTDGAVAITGPGPDHTCKQKVCRHRLCRLRVLGEQWIDVPIELSRDIPQGALVFAASLRVRRVGTRWVYSVTLTIDEAESPRTPRPSEGHGAVNFGWRRVEGGVRVALCVGDTGELDECVLPDKLIGAMKHHEGLRALADAAAVAALGSTRGRHRARREQLAGKGPSPLNHQPFDPATSTLEHWARRDRHLYQWESDEREHCLLARREIYRLWARSLRAKYATLTMEDFSIHKLAGETGEEHRIKAARHVRFLVAPSYLRQEIKTVFGEDCKVLAKAERTCKCRKCGHTGKYDRTELVLKCERCGATWDQDVNNALNQLSEVAAE